jgi:hypothetical protein
MRLTNFMPFAVLVMVVLMLLAVFAVDTTAARIALVVAILGVGVIFSSAMLISGRNGSAGRR